MQQAWSRYHSPVDYGVTGLDLPKVVALIEAGFHTRLYYTSYRNNAFDTHVFQGDLHQRLLTYTSDAVTAFVTDLERIGRANDVVIMMFSEFGRRVPENTNLGTDHGAANLMFVAGKRHFWRFALLSVRNQPSRFTTVGPALWISIQSASRLFSSRNPLVLLARNSVIVTCSAPRTRTQKAKMTPHQ